MPMKGRYERSCLGLPASGRLGCTSRHLLPGQKKGSRDYGRHGVLTSPGDRATGIGAAKAAAEASGVGPRPNSASACEAVSPGNGPVVDPAKGTPSRSHAMRLRPSPKKRWCKSRGHLSETGRRQQGSDADTQRNREGACPSAEQGTNWVGMSTIREE